MGSIAVTKDKAAAEFLRHADGVGREIPADELARYAPNLAGSFAFEPADHFMFGPSVTGPYLGPPYEKGNHGFWPMRQDYRSVYVLWGTGVTAESIGPIQMTDVAGRLAGVVGIPWSLTEPSSTSVQKP